MKLTREWMEYTVENVFGPEKYPADRNTAREYGERCIRNGETRDAFIHSISGCDTFRNEKGTPIGITGAINAFGNSGTMPGPEPKQEKAKQPQGDTSSVTYTEAHESLPVGDLRKLAVRKEQMAGKRSSWVALAKKSDLLAFLRDGKRPTDGAKENHQGSHEVRFVDTLIEEIQRRGIVDYDKIRSLVLATMDEHSRPILNFAFGDCEIEVKDQAHRMLPEMIDCAKAVGNVALVGPAGTGKTTLALQCATALGLGFKAISTTAGMPEGHLVGRLLPSGDYMPGVLADAFEKPCLFLQDETDAADANTLLVLNSALDNGILPLPNRRENPCAMRHDQFVYVACMNTYGNGANGFEYAGRGALDAAYLNRFGGNCTVLYVDYDREIEKAIAAAGNVECLLSPFWKIRENVTEGGVRRPISSRVIKALGRLHLLSPERYPVDTSKDRERMLRRMFAGWSKEEIAKAVSGVTF